ncbi:hypothetical protein DSLASN_19320 [Desulfoluna limicola]|uniref:Endonuclease/exonuclease/phosphatase domain-containing protein n=1 Tax=Desulfoluna limicola TaxID=2810562 RepID=A0ABM7PGR3_9BACT|nr:hypothetical protein DSLASN_19320 [Desulfoluna limicola]
MVVRSEIWARLLAGFFLFLFLQAPPASAQQQFRLVSYNVENLFDLTRNGSEYTGYIPHTGYGWNETAVKVKYANIASVLAEIGAHVAVLSEVENAEALRLLQDFLTTAGHPMAHGAVSKRPTTVRCAVLSTFPITEVHEVTAGQERRSILRVTLDIQGTAVMVYANHWKSKRGPESRRLPYARALAADIATLPPQTDYILAGDFNSDHNEWLSFLGEPRLNDTLGRTGINHLLGTMYNEAMATEEGVQKGQGSHYDLWMELSPNRRWSYNFFGKKGSLDHILLPAAMYDDRGVSYVDGSFGRHAPDRLFHNGGIYRWQRAKKGQGRHLGRGYSDHLPIYADFIVGPFVAARGDDSDRENPASAMPRMDKSVADLYNLPLGPANYRISGVVVLYKAGLNAVVKAPQGRAIYLYKAGEALEPGWVVDLTVTRLNDYYGLREVTSVADVVTHGKTNPEPLFLKVNGNVDLRESDRVNEVVDKVCGLYRGGWLRYGSGRSVRVYTVKGIKRPKNDTRICLSRVRIGFHKHPELVVDSQRQIVAGP